MLGLRHLRWLHTTTEYTEIKLKRNSRPNQPECVVGQVFVFTLVYPVAFRRRSSAVIAGRSGVFAWHKTKDRIGTQKRTRVERVSSDGAHHGVARS